MLGSFGVYSLVEKTGKEAGSVRSVVIETNTMRTRRNED